MKTRPLMGSGFCFVLMQKAMGDIIGCNSHREVTVHIKIVANHIKIMVNHIKNTSHHIKKADHQIKMKTSAKHVYSKKTEQ
ncbi:hypothetical protein ABE65_003555 [Fictibacillus phosphorivorans]|uniref:Uncharacterized protein n=1 Tax=Fictibacillus phosphorivorans TaxID=1221500 RepID=A0A160IJF2_9BACL|nr:hypothetical protein ABE65_003555 [Fictibacillus phosphorivorans]